MSEGDSAQEFISIHALGRKKLLVLSGRLPSHVKRIKFCIESCWETIEIFCLSFQHTSREKVSSTEA